ncbi:RING finger protein vilya [Drosophila ficusphila]|uniref:RING finger protein vilya n=1 Tax=Drosophila ficusphila TaxID=30025 RepID=UPI0007E71392|nr:RING finger protein vilya [Drosophila ficusphila]
MQARPRTPSGEPEAHKLWIHCNCCCALYAEKKCDFFLLACHHVCCERCVKVVAGRTPSDAPIFECRTCKRSVRGRQVNNAMPNNFKQFFHPKPFTLTNDFIEKFQRGNNHHFDRHKNKKEAEMYKLNRDIELAKSVCQKRLREVQMLNVERKKLVQRARQIKTQLEIKKAEIQRNSQAKMSRSLESQSHLEDSVRGRNRLSPKNSGSRRSSNDFNRKHVTSFIHQPNHSFNL